MMTVLVQLVQIHGIVDSLGLKKTIESLCSYHAPLGQGYEVAWALWLACVANISLDSSIGALVALMDDDLVALVSLDLCARNLLALPTTTLWNSYMNGQHLYSEHWLLCYEALEQGWLTSSDGTDYVGNDSFFSILRSNYVRFYDQAGLGGAFT